MSNSCLIVISDRGICHYLIIAIRIWDVVTSSRRQAASANRVVLVAKYNTDYLTVGTLLNTGAAVRSCILGYTSNDQS